MDEAEQRWEGFAAEALHGLKGKEKEKAGKIHDKEMGREVALLVKCLVRKHEDLSTQCKKSGVVDMLVVVVLGRGRSPVPTGRPVRLAVLVISRFSLS